MTPFSLKETLKEYISGQFDEEVVLARINNSMTKITKNNLGEFNTDELQWLKIHFDKIPNILKSKFACAIFLMVDKQKGAYLRQLCKRLGKRDKTLNPNAVNYWLKKFFSVDLLQKNRTARGWGTEIYYYTPKLRFPNLINFLKTIMSEKIIEDQTF